MAKQQKIIFLGDSLERLRDFPSEPKQRLGYQLSSIQSGLTPSDWDSVPGLGKGINGVREIRERTGDGFFRVIYVANIADIIYVLHAYAKQSNQIEKKDINIIKQRYKNIQKEA